MVCLRRPGKPTSEYEQIFEEVEAPFAFVDLDAMWANADSMLERAAGKPIRVASKSVRCRALLEKILRRDERFAGLLTFTLPETLWLAEHGLRGPAARLPDRRLRGAAASWRCARSPTRPARRS